MYTMPAVSPANSLGCYILDWQGHEHECLIQWQESVVGTFMISQPGSSVATSLCAGEAVRKQVGILDIRKKQFRLYAVPLTQVRSFVTTEVSLRENKAHLDPEDPNIERKISALLVERAQVLILNAREERTLLLDEAKKLGNDAGDEDCPTKYKLLNPEEVLVRIRVEHGGFAAINNQARI
jgi:double-strand break repair protein MRE11